MKNNEIKKYVRVKNIVRDKFVEFDFAIGDPVLFVELILPKAAYKIFCEKNNVIEMNEEQIRKVEQEMERWRYGKDSLVSKNKNVFPHTTHK